MFVFIKKTIIGLLTSLVNDSNYTKGVSLKYQQCMIQLHLINLLPNEYSQSLCYHLFAVNLDRCVGSCNSLNDLSNSVCIPAKIEDLNLCVFKMITGINESKTLIKHISCKCKCKFDGRKCNSNEKWNKNKFRCERKNLKEHHVCGK